jgi:hypothetical protein
METKETTNKTKMDKSHRNPVQTNQKKVLGKVSKMKPRKPKFKKDQQVYLTAFLKEERGVFYVCKGIIQEVPGPSERQVYKVKIVAVADHAIGGPPVVRQARLLGLNCIKRTRELNNELAVFMTPSKWIDEVPEDQKRKKRHPRHALKYPKKRSNDLS